MGGLTRNDRSDYWTLVSPFVQLDLSSTVSLLQSVKKVQHDATVRELESHRNCKRFVAVSDCACSHSFSLCAHECLHNSQGTKRRWLTRHEFFSCIASLNTGAHQQSYEDIFRVFDVLQPVEAKMQGVSLSLGAGEEGEGEENEGGGEQKGGEGEEAAPAGNQGNAEDEENLTDTKAAAGYRAIYLDELLSVILLHCDEPLNDR